MTEVLYSLRNMLINQRLVKKAFTDFQKDENMNASRICVPSLRRGCADLCVVPTLVCAAEVSTPWIFREDWNKTVDLKIISHGWVQYSNV